MPKDPVEILNSVKKGVYSPVYFLQGEESFYIDQISDHIENHAIEESQRGFNQMIMYGKDVDMSQVILNAKRFPMMSDRQVVIVKEAQEIRDLGKEGGSKLLLDYIANPLPSTILVMCHKNKALDGRKPVAKALDKSAILVTTKKLYDNQVPDWITGYLKSKGCGIENKAVTMLQESVGNSLSKLSNEIDKVLINFKDKVTITPDHVEQYVGISKDYNVFELQKCLITKDVAKVNRIIHYFEQDPRSNPVIPIIAILFSYFSKLLVAQKLKDKSEGSIMSALKIGRFQVRDYMSGLRSYKLGQVLYIIKYLSEADLRSKGIKGGTMNDAAILKELVFKIMHC